jgi:epoxyqueuosine reductase
VVGIAPAQPPPQAALLDGLLQKNPEQCLAYLKRDAAVRKDVRRWYPEAKSVLLCGFEYAGQPKDGGPAVGRIARYAVNEDYHRVLRRRMRSILSWLRQNQAGADGRIFVDSSPVTERLYAAAAGLGWIGRNRLLISEAAGSFFLIAGLALNLELESDRPVADRCGSCRRCIDACPTGALDGEHGFSAERCVAYLTIEHRGPIPLKLRAGIGRWVAGCDLCQEACPWNGRAARDMLPAILPQELALEDIVKTDEAGFRERFGRTPVARLKRQGLLRNALLAMGNSADASLRPVLERFQEDPDPVLREQARWSLSRLPA